MCETRTKSFTDLRSQSERERERSVQSPLEPKYEALAQQLCRLLASGATDGIVRIGEQIYGDGGHKAMQLVHYRVLALCGRGPSACWNGIGTWQH
jgi:hypothetical protein